MPNQRSFKDTVSSVILRLHPSIHACKVSGVTLTTQSGRESSTYVIFLPCSVPPRTRRKKATRDIFVNAETTMIFTFSPKSLSVCPSGNERAFLCQPLAPAALLIRSVPSLPPSPFPFSNRVHTRDREGRSRVESVNLSNSRTCAAEFIRQPENTYCTYTGIG